MAYVRGTSRRRSISLVAVTALLCSEAVSADRTMKNSWVGTWSCSPQLVETRNMPPAPGLAGNTLRQIAHVTLGGQQIRLRFSNEFGNAPLSLVSVHIALPAEPGAIRADTDRTVNFGGQPAVSIPSGALMFSDPVGLPLAPLSDIAVSIQFGQVPEDVTGHPGSRETSYLSAGNQVSSATLPSPVATDHWYVLDGIDVATQGKAGALVTLGDSITDGRGSLTNQNTRWPDDLARTFAAGKKTANVGVLNEGIGGNRILQDGLGPNALSRFDRDVIGQTGIRWLIVLEGVNDIGTAKAAAGPGAPSTVAADVILAYKQFILRAHAHGVRIYGGTITPFAGSSYANASTLRDWDAVNDWIRTCNQFDGVIDFDKAVRDPRNPEQLDPAADSGDHLHPNSEGYRRMAAAVDPAWFTK
ncbi:MAG: SGNH/GDSL hydrolase family protein [Terracidiphilus sp.]